MIGRELAESLPDRHRHDLAFSLRRLAVILAAPARNSEALSPAQEAVAIYRELAAAAPERYRPDHSDAVTRATACERD